MKASATSARLMFIPDVAGTTRVHNPRANNVAEGKGDKGNRGTGEQGNRDEKGRENKEAAFR